MICFPNAKINVGLHVVSRRPDGYHNIETVFYPIGLKDALEVVPVPHGKRGATLSVTPGTGLKNAAGVAKLTERNGLKNETEVAKLTQSAGLTEAVCNSSHPQKIRFFQTGIPVAGTPEDNLVMKALRLVASEKALPDIDIHLLKTIPAGAGLGGGSSDAAFMLTLLNSAFDLGYSQEELMQRAARLGADCPFFIMNRPAYATGTGNQLEPIEMDLSSYSLLLVKPDITVSTRDAYAMIIPRKPDLPLKEIVQKPPDSWKELLKNDFEAPVFKKFPEICKIRQRLYEMGAVYASMSGSGSSVFGLFEKLPDWRGAFNGCFVWKK